VGGRDPGLPPAPAADVTGRGQLDQPEDFSDQLRYNEETAPGPPQARGGDTRGADVGAACELVGRFRRRWRCSPPACHCCWPPPPSPPPVRRARSRRRRPRRYRPPPSAVRRRCPRARPSPVRRRSRRPRRCHRRRRRAARLRTGNRTGGRGPYRWRLTYRRRRRRPPRRNLPGAVGGGDGALGGGEGTRTASVFLDGVARGLIVGGLVGLLASMAGMLFVGRLRRRY
jgi:hypothetical protein